MGMLEIEASTPLPSDQRTSMEARAEHFVAIESRVSLSGLSFVTIAYVIAAVALIATVWDVWQPTRLDASSQRRFRRLGDGP